MRIIIKKVRDITWMVILIFFFCCLITGNGVADVVMVKDKSWSFEFKRVPVPEAVAEISRTSGIKIILHGNADKSLLTKTYKDYSIEKALIDVLNGENIAALFQYSESELSSVYIWVLPKALGGFLNAGMPPISVHNNQIPRPSLAEPWQGYREMQEIAKDSGLNTGVAVSGNRGDLKETSEDSKNRFIYFRSLPGKGNTIDSSDVDSSSENRGNQNTEPKEILVIPSPESEQLRGLEPPPMPPGIVIGYK